MDYNSELEGARQHSIWKASPEGQANAMRILQNEALQAYDPASGYSENEWMQMYMANKGQNDTRQWSQPAPERRQAAPEVVYRQAAPLAGPVRTTEPGWHPDTQQLNVRY